MNIYLVERSECDYDEFSGFVVAAKTAEDALAFLDREYRVSYEYSEWPNHGEKTAEPIGTTDKYDETTVILGSYNAG
jgi:hypothetical protein